MPDELPPNDQRAMTAIDVMRVMEQHRAEIYRQATEQRFFREYDATFLPTDGPIVDTFPKPSCFVEPDYDQLHYVADCIKTRNVWKLRRRDGKTTALLYMLMWSLSTAPQDETHHIFLVDNEREVRRCHDLFMELIIRNGSSLGITNARTGHGAGRWCSVHTTTAPRHICFISYEEGSRNGFRGHGMYDRLWTTYCDEMQYVLRKDEGRGRIYNELLFLENITQHGFFFT